MVLFFVNARYRMPVAFMTCIWSAAGLEELVAAWRSGSRQRIARGFGIVGAAAALLALLAVPQRGHPLPWEWDQAASLASAGRYEQAEGWVSRALARRGDDPALRHAAASFYDRWGKPEREREQLRAMLALPDLEPDLTHLGYEALARSYLEEERLVEARDSIDRALEVRVDDALWRGRPHYPLGLGPLAGCWSRLLAVQIDLESGAVERARDELEAVRESCGEGGRLGPRLLELEVLLVRENNVNPML